jgi:hypothetical protein
VPFLKLTRDRRGYEHTYLLHAEAAAERPRILYWYRTAPEVAIGRPALDEEAIRQIEEQHPLIDFDWPAILALRDAMLPEEELVPQGREARRDRRSERRDEWRERGRGRTAGRADPGSAVDRPAVVTQPRAERPERAALTPDVFTGDPPRIEHEPPSDEDAFGHDEGTTEEAAARHRSVHGLLEELVGREIATRLRARHAELLARIREHVPDDQTRAEWMASADALDPDTWVTPHDVLDGVQHADQRCDDLRRRLTGS